MKKELSRWGVRCVCTALAAVTILGTSAQAVFAASPAGRAPVPPATVEPKAEEFQYYYRIYNGTLQIRVWSLTFGRWVTDWMDYDEFYDL